MVTFSKVASQIFKRTILILENNPVLETTKSATTEHTTVSTTANILLTESIIETTSEMPPEKVEEKLQIIESKKPTNKEEKSEKLFTARNQDRKESITT